MVQKHFKKMAIKSIFISLIILKNTITHFEMTECGEFPQHKAVFFRLDGRFIKQYSG